MENQYLSEALIYIGAVIPKNERNEFLDLIKREHRDGVSIMETVADSFREEGKRLDKFEIARKMIKKGMSTELIMELTELPVKQIEELRANKTRQD